MRSQHETCNVVFGKVGIVGGPKKFYYNSEKGKLHCHMTLKWKSALWSSCCCFQQCIFQIVDDFFHLRNISRLIHQRCSCLKSACVPLPQDFSRLAHIILNLVVDPPLNKDFDKVFIKPLEEKIWICIGLRTSVLRKVCL